MTRFLAACITATLTLTALPAPALAASEVKPLHTSTATEWVLGAWQTDHTDANGALNGPERPALVYFIPTCTRPDICPGTLVVVWQSAHTMPAPTTIPAISQVTHIYRTGLNTYRLAISTGTQPYECATSAPRGCPTLPPLKHKTLFVDTWARTVTRS